MKPQNTMNEDWKYLIVLDACRYDYFKQIYKKFIDGSLERRQSPAKWTLEWLSKTFVGTYRDVHYISPVPFCNSRGKICKRKSIFYDAICFNAKKHFGMIYDLWDEPYWNTVFNTVLPCTINDFAKLKISLNPDRRFVIHYFQPHFPYPHPNFRCGERRKRVDYVSSLSSVIKTAIPNIIQFIFGTKMLWHVAYAFGIKPTTPMEETWRMTCKDDEAIRDIYRKNLVLVLSYVSELIEWLPPGRVAVTADHGELLGEGNCWGHGPLKPSIPELVTVPWLEVKR